MIDDGTCSLGTIPNYKPREMFTCILDDVNKLINFTEDDISYVADKYSIEKDNAKELLLASEAILIVGEFLANNSASIDSLIQYGITNGVSKLYDRYEDKYDEIYVDYIKMLTSTGRTLDEARAEYEKEIINEIKLIVNISQ